MVVCDIEVQPDVPSVRRIEVELNDSEEEVKEVVVVQDDRDSSDTVEEKPIEVKQPTPYERL
jgi:hypothetical protein